MVSGKFLSYFHKELNYLRNAGAVFAAQHPKIARRLDWTKGDQTADPHVERLLESFAFLSARLHQDLDDRFPQIASGLLQVLYPQLLNPLPSMAIAQFAVDPSKAKMTTGYPITKHTPLFAYAEEGLQCKFRTAFPITLWPIHLVYAGFAQTLNYTHLENYPRKSWYLKLVLKADKLSWNELDLDSLTFHLAGDRLTAIRLYQAIFAQDIHPVLFSPDGKNLKLLHLNAITPVGFDREEQLLPPSPHNHCGYQLLQEYFHFPEKYLFFKMNHLLKAISFCQSDTLEIFIPIEESALINSLDISKENFLLGCTPIVNLFEKTTDPLRLTHRQVEYRITADSRLERTHEIYNLKSVRSVTDQGSVLEYRPYYSFEHRQESDIFWYSRREPSEKRGIPGTDLYLSFVNHKFDPMAPPQETIFAEALCTNRFLPEQLPAGATLQFEGKLPVVSITCLDRPISPSYTPHDGETLWKLVSQLSIHHLGYTDPKIALQILKETLSLYANLTQKSSLNQIEALIALSIKPVTRRIHRHGQDQAWRGFIRGVGVDLTVDEGIDPTGTSFMLAAVLRHFFALNTSVDTFAQLTLKGTHHQTPWVTWKPLSGQHLLL